MTEAKPNKFDHVCSCKYPSSISAISAALGDYEEPKIRLGGKQPVYIPTESKK